MLHVTDEVTCGGQDRQGAEAFSFALGFKTTKRTTNLTETGQLKRELLVEF